MTTAPLRPVIYKKTQTVPMWVRLYIALKNASTPDKRTRSALMVSARLATYSQFEQALRTIRIYYGVRHVITITGGKSEPQYELTGDSAMLQCPHCGTPIKLQCEETYHCRRCNKVVLETELVERGSQFDDDTAPSAEADASRMRQWQEGVMV